ncbi:hypothetical protein C7212DRAFT_343092 [Tuber magnatum]|uniref:Uncharacterized protein n=1 Tax=Tuber magnatum TaxID=42249 RepID=A0A317SVT5_9PEZI|nr:hypothetical protein C7212DRAFT_343092 [Tuber magnatum]
MVKSQEQPSTAISNPNQETFEQGQSITKRLEALANMASTSKSPGPGAPLGRSPPSGTVPASVAPPPVPFRQQPTALAPAPTTPTGSWHQPPGTPQATSVAPASLAPAPTAHTGPWHQPSDMPATGAAPALETVPAGLAPPPLPTWQQPTGTPQATGMHTAHGVPQDPTTQGGRAAETRPPAQGSSRHRKRIARIANSASGLLQGNQPADTLPVPNHHANTVPANNRRDASATRVKTPDADFTIEELQQDQVFSVPTSGIDGMGRVVAYQKTGFGRSVIVATGPNVFCKYRIWPARDYGIGCRKTDIPLVTPRLDAHGRGFALAGIAYQDKGDLGPAVLNPGLRQMQRTYINVKWDNGAPDTWEMRTILRQLRGKAVADQAICDSVSKFELDA